MMPFGLTAAQFQRRYRTALEQASAQLISQLRALLTLPLPDAVREAEVQLFFNEDGVDIPSAWIYFQGKNNRVDNADPGIFPGRSMPLSLGLDEMEAFDERYLDDESMGLGLMADTVKAWFAECWWKAGGWSYAIPCQLSVHDGWGDGSTIALSEGQ
ncbi:hypothetical protein WH50_24115 [Pokkaliibacter plantistimulans]|uniref:Uncharacterized protein n=1 Tax=Pokkaliibacter plantistimulans TaxID=1635171 RepID=A0ABX5LU79_9GAMM|nr:hypothetical protein [Pokkaliibacter plantistimulans]PXF28836.1 hypothetical protein WH50_24115 [Pokkaliibacter plantistimulans]